MKAKMYMILFIPFIFSQLKGVEASYTLDFSGGFGMNAFEETPLRRLGRSEKTLNLPNDSIYRIKLSNNLQVIFETYIGTIRKSNEDPDVASRLVLTASNPDYYLTIEEAITVFEKFHDTFQIPKEPLYEWFKPIKEGLGGRGFYQAIAKNHYPEIALEAANSFFDDKPVFLVLYVDFDERTLRRRGVSEETNRVANLIFNIPAIINSVKPQAQSAEIPATPPGPEVEEVVQESTAPKPATAKPAEVKTPDTSKEPAEQSSKWWLWLIGAVVVGGIGLAVRRKS